MGSNNDLTDFVKTALAEGHSKTDIEATLGNAGWSGAETKQALSAWASTDFDIPVPQPRSTVRASDVFSYGLLFVAILMISINLVNLSFDIINMLVPDDANNWFFTANGRWEIAVLIVFVPTFFWLHNRLNKKAATDTGAARSTLRRWLAYISLLITSLVLLGDLVYVLYAFLDGELSLRAILKAASVAIVAGLVFAYYRHEVGEVSDDG